jgi:hypothetical protein
MWGNAQGVTLGKVLRMWYYTTKNPLVLFVHGANGSLCLVEILRYLPMFRFLKKQELLSGLEINNLVLMPS